MSSGARWTVRILAVACGLFLGVIAVVGAFDSAAELSVTTNDAARRTLELQVAGHVLTAVGFIGLYGNLACRNRAVEDLSRSFTQQPGVPRGIRATRLATRQINGAQPYREDEVSQLRRLAERRVAKRRLTPSAWFDWIVITILLAGFILAPPDFGATVWQLIFQILCGALLLTITGTVLRQWLRPTDVNAEAFLERTKELHCPADEHL